MKKKTLKQTLSMIVVLTLLLGILPVNAWAVDHVHDADCGYAPASECTHSHDETCGYAEAIVGADCSHTHGDCSYVAASVGTPCNHTCDFDVCGYSPAISGNPCNDDCPFNTTGTHNSDCNYSEGEPGSPCTHTHDDSCGYVAPVAGVACDHQHDVNCGYVEAVEAKPCTHEHNDTCGYSEGSECTYVEPPVEETGHTHVWSEEWANNGTTHWHECTAAGCDLPVGVADLAKSGYGDHSYDSNYTCTTCGYTCPHSGAETNYNMDSTHHWGECGNGTCGYTTDKEAHDQNGENGRCSVCYYDPNSSTDPDEHKHDWGDWTANGDGTHTRTCTIDANHTETADCAVYTYAQVDEQTHNILCECFSGENYYVLGTEAHTMSEWVRDGEGERRECTKNCDYFEEREVHSHSYTAVVTDPTCDDKGYTTYTCGCGDSYVDDYTDASGHDWGAWENMQDGSHSRICKADDSHYEVVSCSYEVTEIAALTHLLTCSECGDYEWKNHDWVSVDNDPHTAKCTVCGKESVDEHAYIIWRYDGTNHWRVCGCGQGLTGSVKAHTFGGWELDEDGHWRVCTECGYANQKKSHIYSNDSDEDCNECGYERNVHTHSYSTATCTTPATCSCGATTGSKDPSNHAGGTEIRNAKEATETENGYTGDTYCKGCGAKLASGKRTNKLGFVDVKYDDDVVVKEVTFQPIKGVDISDDAEVIVEDHTATIEPIAGLVGENANTEYVSLDDEDIEITEPLTFTYNGVTYRIDEVVKIEDTEYIVSSITTSVSLMRLTDGVVFEFNRYSGVMQKFSTGTYKKMSSKLSINGVTYDVVAAFNPYDISEDKLDTDRLTYWVLYYEGKPVGRYFPNQGWATFDENYTPATLKAQQYNIFIGSVTVPEKDKGLKTRAELVADLEAAQQACDEYMHEHHELSPALAMAKDKAEQALAEYDAIAQLAAKKRYNVYEIGANDISIKNATAVSGTVTQTFEVPAEFVGNENVKYIAVHDPNPYAKELAEAAEIRFLSPHNEMEYMKIKSLYDSWAEENKSVEYGSVTVAEDGKTLIATYEVDSFSPFIVYAFVEADEPEIKTLSATIEIPDESAPQAPAPAVEDAPGSSIFLWITIMSLAAIALLAVVIVAAKRKRR